MHCLLLWEGVLCFSCLSLLSFFFLLFDDGFLSRPLHYSFFFGSFGSTLACPSNGLLFLFSRGSSLPTLSYLSVYPFFSFVIVQNCSPTIDMQKSEGSSFSLSASFLFFEGRNSAKFCCCCCYIFLILLSTKEKERFHVCFEERVCVRLSTCIASNVVCALGVASILN
jgi:hypothetical protein